MICNKKQIKKNLSTQNVVIVKVITLSLPSPKSTFPQPFKV